MTDPIADYEEGLKKLEAKKEAAIQALRQRLKGEKAAAKKTEKQIADLTGVSTTGTQNLPEDGEKPPRKKSSYAMTDAHKEAIRRGKQKKKAELEASGQQPKTASK
ncbi:MAG: hypothetical protein H0W20_12260 [Chthoniobacterales bacterium]|nr:hypothetical protein [Chthoniobacterales bacterium]